MDWRPSATLDVLHTRARMLQGIRAFFASRVVTEVTVPLASNAAVTDPNIESLAVSAAGGSRYLHTSPEFAMKRLLAAGSGDIYYLGPVFRAGEVGRRHGPEFTMLEWYRLGFDLDLLMHEVEALLQAQIAAHRALQPATYLTYREAFLRHAGIDPFGASVEALRACAESAGQSVSGELDRDGWLDLLISFVVAPRFATDRLTFIRDFPASQASLARTRVTADDCAVADRFEVYWGELELANGFHELSDADEQRRRFERDLATRAARGQATLPMDTRLLEALAAGLPDCAGVSVGVDRLLMVMLDLDDIAEVLSFDWQRA